MRSISLIIRLPLSVLLVSVRNTYKHNAISKTKPSSNVTDADFGRFCYNPICFSHIQGNDIK